MSELIAQLLGTKPNPALSRCFSAGAFGADGGGRAVLGTDNVCEQVAGLLFRTVEWARHAPFFPELPVARQVALLRPRWSELFQLNCASGTAPARGAASGRARLFTDQVRAFQEQVDKLGRRQVDSPASRPSRSLRLTPVASPTQRTGENLQETAQVALTEYVRAQYRSQPQRFGRPLLQLPGGPSQPPSTPSCSSCAWWARRPPSR